MDKNEPFVHGEVDYETPKQSPQSSQTWSMEKIRQSHFQQKLSSLLSPVTPKTNFSPSNARSLLLQCLRDAKSDPLPRRRFPVSCADEGILMDGVLVTSATGKKVSDSPSSFRRRSARSSIFRSQNKNTEFICPRSESGCNQAANSSNLKASTEPFTLTPRYSPKQASSFAPQQLPYDHYNPLFPWDNPLHLQPYPYLHRPRPPFYVYQRPPPFPVLPHGLDLNQLGPTGSPIKKTPIKNDPYQLDCPTTFPVLTGSRSSLRKTPSSSHPNRNTTKQPVHTTTHGSSPTVDEVDKVMQKTDLSSSTSDGVETVTQKREWSPSDDGLPTFTQEENDFIKKQGRVLPDSAIKFYKFRGGRLSCFKNLCSDDRRNSKPKTNQVTFCS